MRTTLATLFVAGVGFASPGAAQQVRQAVVMELQDTSATLRRRPFLHTQHESVSCSSCHGTGTRHRTLLVNTPRDCASCHHEPRRAQTCASCHATGQLPALRPVNTPMSLSVWDSVGTRTLPFRHDVHIRAGTAVACQECHRTPVTLASNRPCASCHEQHHRPEATCTACHIPPTNGVHKAAAHLSCAGSGCHATAVAPPPTLSRTLCLSCHVEQKDHEPQGSCATCHGIPTERHRRSALPGRPGLPERNP